MRSTLLEIGLRGLSQRFLTSRRNRAVMTALGVALGVALIVAMTVLGATLQASIRDQLRQGFGTYDIMAGYHGDRLMTAAEQATVGSMPEVQYSVGVLWLDPHQTQTKGVGMSYNYIGMGAFPDGEFAYPIKSGHRPGPGEFAAEERVTQMLGLKQVGDTVTLPFKTGPQTVRLSGFLPTQLKGSSDSLTFDITWLQKQMGLEGQATLRLVGLKKNSTPDKLQVQANMLQRLPDLDVQIRSELDDVIRNMGGLKPMAVAFGLAGLVASIMLVAGSFTIAVQERSRELALLRAVGATPRQVMDLVMREALLLGVAGGLIGVGAGVLGAVGAASAAARSLGVSPHAATLPWLWLALEWAAGLLLALVAAWRPARRAGAVAPLAAMRPDASAQARAERAGGRAGLVLVVLSAGLIGLALVLEGGSGARALTGTLGGLGVTVGLVMALPRILPVVVETLAYPLRLLFPAEALLAGRSVLRHRRRSSLTVATLVLGVMLLSSVSTVLGELSRNGEAYVRSQFAGQGQVETPMGIDTPMDQATVGAVAQIPGIDRVVPVRLRMFGSFTNLDLTHADPEWVAAFDSLFFRPQDFNLAVVDPVALGQLFDFGRVRGSLGGGGLVLTEQQAKERGLTVGTRLQIAIDRRVVNQEHLAGEYSAPVTAIVEHSPFNPLELILDSKVMPGVAPDRLILGYAPAALKSVKEAILPLLARPGQIGLSFRDLTEAVEENRQMTNQRYSLVGAVVLVIFLTAAMGLVNAIVSGLAERRRELATLRAVGSTPAQTVLQVTLEALLLGLSGALLGLLSGAVFTAAVMVALDGAVTAVPLWLVLACLVTTPVVAALAGLAPARGVARGSVAELLRLE